MKRYSEVSDLVSRFQDPYETIENKLTALETLQTKGFLPYGLLMISSNENEINKIVEQYKKEAYFKIEINLNPNFVFSSAINVAITLKIPLKMSNNKNYVFIPLLAKDIFTFLELVQQYSNNLPRLN
ncbi:MAG: hypothetical protein QXE31_03120 [Candidatus Woesearchaeota archaeon]